MSGGGPPQTDLVADVLADYGGATRARMASYLPDREPQRYLYSLVADYPARGGRGMRPSICIATARVFGRPVEDAVLTAVSIEMLHNAMLIHDDVQDESELRRGQPALHQAQGVPLAINAGDTLALLAMQPLMDNQHRLGPWLSRRLLEETQRMALESAEGQALELGWRRENVVSVTELDYLEMVMKKTCWLATIHPLRVGGLIGTGGTVDPNRFLRLGMLLGAAFQIQDDLLNLAGDAAAYGKELGGDLWEGKRTLMLIHLLEQGTASEREEIEAIYARPRSARTRAELDFLAGAMERYDCLEYARAVAHGLAGAAMAEAELLFARHPPSRDRSFLLALPRWVIERR